MGHKRRFVIVDPSLKDGRGHHYELALRITRSILAAEMKPVWLCNKSYMLGESQSGVEILPALGVSMYDAYQRGNRLNRMPVFKGHRMLIRLIRLLEKISGLAQTDDRQLLHKARMTRNVNSAQGRVEYVRVRLFTKDEILWAEPVLGKSGLIHTMVKADGLVCVGMNTEGLDKDEIVDVIPL